MAWRIAKTFNTNKYMRMKKASSDSLAAGSSSSNSSSSGGGGGGGSSSNISNISNNNSSSSGAISSSGKATWERRLETAKQKHRPKLKNWRKDGFAYPDRRERDFLALRDLPPNQVKDVNPSVAFNKRSNRSLGNEGIDALIQKSYHEKHIERVSCRKMSVECFIDQYELIEKPCVITGIPEQEQWPALENWDFKNKSFFHQIRKRMFKVGEDDDGYKVKVAMKHFIKYLKNNDDDSPLYIFDSNYDDDAVAKCLLNDYKVPEYFTDDLFSAVGEEKRPPYRWFLLGPERSGTTLHIDPLGTSAWNTVIQGRKRWVLFPPGTSKSVAKGLDLIEKGQDDEAVNYFVDILPRIKAKYGHNTEIVEFTQGPGDTVYVPGGWWHAVLNLDNTIAITQNYCSRTNFHHVWRKTRTGRRKMSVKWLNKLVRTHPELVDQALEIDRDDNFTLEFAAYLKVSDKYRQSNSNSNSKSNNSMILGASAVASDSKERSSGGDGTKNESSVLDEGGVGESSVLDKAEKKSKSKSRSNDDSDKKMSKKRKTA